MILHYNIYNLKVLRSNSRSIDAKKFYTNLESMNYA